jgi:hypothetical protein
MQLRLLRELTASINDIVGLEVIKKNTNWTSRYKLLFELMLDTSLSEKQIVRKIYKEPNSEKQFRVLKQRFKTKLIDAFLLSQLSAEIYKSKYHMQKTICIKNWTASHILRDVGFTKLSHQIKEQILSRAKIYDLTEYCLLLANELTIYYGLIDFDSKKYNQYEKLLEKYEHEYELYRKAVKYYIYFGQIVLNNRFEQNNKAFATRCSELKTLYEKYHEIDSYFIKYYMFNAIYFMALHTQDLNLQLKTSNEAIEYFEKKKGFSFMGIFSFMQKKAIFFLIQGKYQLSEIEIQKSFKYLRKENALSLQSLFNYLFIIKLNQADYNQNYLILSKVFKLKGFNKLNDTFREPWYLKEAFVHFLIRVGKIDTAAFPEVKLRAFRLSRFINEVPTYSKDKKGFNITINIIQMLFLLLDRKYDRFLNKLQSLKQYNYRYLRDEKYIRPSSFIKMMGKIPVGRYRSDIIRHKAEKYYKKLQENPFNFTEQALSLEIIPYEQLWEEVLTLFERQTSIR